MIPGERWRFQAWGGSDRIAHSSDGDPSIFDELVVDGWFHIEQMDECDWWMRVTRTDGTDLTINVTVDPKTGLASLIRVENDL